MSHSSAKDANGSSNREAKGFIVLITVLIIPFLLQYGYRYFFYQKVSTTLQITYIKEDCEPEQSFKSYSGKRNDYVSYANYAKKEKKHQEIVNINTADSLMLEKLPGIGFKLAARIIKYRSLLRGYVKIDQLKEVYGLPEETYDKIKGLCIVSASDAHQLPADSLWNTPYKMYHPYLSKELKAEITALKKKEFYQADVLRDKIKKSNEKLNWYVAY